MTKTNALFQAVAIVVLIALTQPLHAQQTVNIPDPGLDAAIRDAVQKPTGPLTDLDLLGLTQLSAGHRNIHSVAGLEAARNLAILDLDNNALTNFSLADVLTNLTILDLFGNGLTEFELTNPPPKLNILDVSINSLERCVLPAGLTNLYTLFLADNALTNLTLPPGLTNLTQLDLLDNQMTELIVPPDLTNLTTLFLGGNPLNTLVLSEPLATNLAATVTGLQSTGVSVYPYPISPRLVRPLPLAGAFKFGLMGPPGNYAVMASTALTNWSQVGVSSNRLGAVNFVDPTAHNSRQRFYRVLPFAPPPDLVFVAPNTFTLGSPTNDLDRRTDEGPQTVVTLSRGYWISDHEVTQGEYLAIMNENPSVFPGDLRRPVSNVTWANATNYCGLLTQRELAAGRIPEGSQYRLPTEAEWECAARAGTTTRFSYGDDPQYLELTNHAWLFYNADLMVHPVAQKLPNPWGLYDMEGNVWEWCLDWYGNFPGGAVTDPSGPASNDQGLRVMRGGAYDYFTSDCRSASRLYYPASAGWSDSDLGFRVVLELRLP